jgi:hypothetical protein
MSWLATVDLEGAETGCVWVQDVSALTIEEDIETEDESGPLSLLAWTGVQPFTVGVFPNRYQAEEALQAVALHVSMEREGQTIGNVNVGNSMTSDSAEPRMLPLGPKAMDVLSKVAEAGGTVALDYLAVAPPAVVAKLMPRYLKEDPAGTAVLTAEGKSLVERFRTAVAP